MAEVIVVEESSTQQTDNLYYAIRTLIVKP